VGDDADNVVELDRVARVEPARYRFLADAGDADLALGIVGLGVIDVERNLAMNADRLDFFTMAGFDPFSIRPV
jgi:hypothetical protein